MRTWQRGVRLMGDQFSMFALLQPQPEQRRPRQSDATLGLQPESEPDITDALGFVRCIRESMAALTEGQPFDIATMESLPIWRTETQRSAVRAVIAMFGIDLKNGMAILENQEAA